MTKYTIYYSNLSSELLLQQIMPQSDVVDEPRRHSGFVRTFQALEWLQLEVDGPDVLAEVPLLARPVRTITAFQDVQAQVHLADVSLEQVL